MRKKTTTTHTEACEGISHSPHIHPPSRAAEITNHTTQIKSPARLPQQTIFRNTFLGLCSPQTRLIMNGLYSDSHGPLTWESMRNDGKYNRFHFMTLYEMTELGIRNLESPCPRRQTATVGLSIVADSSWKAKGL